MGRGKMWAAKAIICPVGNQRCPECENVSQPPWSLREGKGQGMMHALHGHPSLFDAAAAAGRRRFVSGECDWFCFYTWLSEPCLIYWHGIVEIHEGSNGVEDEVITSSKIALCKHKELWPLSLMQFYGASHISKPQSFHSQQG